MATDKSAKPEYKISVYYDGLCHLCSREINHYKKMNGSENIEFVDITHKSFDARQIGLDPAAIHMSLHVKNKIGSIKTGIDAFICIWQELPTIKILASLARIAPIHFILGVLYSGFAKVHPFLPRKSCENSPYCETDSV